MGAAAPFQIRRSLTTNGTSSVAFAGTSGTDYATDTLTPVSRDAAGVFTYRNLTAALSSAVTATFSCLIDKNWVRSRMNVTIPVTVVIDGVSVTRYMYGKVELKAPAETSVVQRQQLRGVVLDMLDTDPALNFDNASSVY